MVYVSDYGTYPVADDSPLRFGVTKADGSWDMRFKTSREASQYESDLRKRLHDLHQLGGFWSDLKV